jgi:hypothetical protein
LIRQTGRHSIKFALRCIKNIGRFIKKAGRLTLKVRGSIKKAGRLTLKVRGSIKKVGRFIKKVGRFIKKLQYWGKNLRRFGKKMTGSGFGPLFPCIKRRCVKKKPGAWPGWVRRYAMRYGAT